MFRRRPLPRAASDSAAREIPEDSFQVSIYDSVASGTLLPQHIQSVRERLSVLCEEHDSAAKLAILRKTLQKEHNAISSSLNSGIINYLSLVSKYQGIVENGPTVPNELAINLAEASELCVKTDKLIDHYDYIKQVSLAHQNILAVRSVFDRFVILNADFERLASMLDEETDPANQQPGIHLVAIHALLLKLNDFKHETLYQVKGKSGDVLETLSRYFKRLEHLDAQFNAFFWDRLCPSILEMVMLSPTEPMYALIRKIVSIIEKEETRDSKTIQLQNALSKDSRRSTFCMKMASVSTINRLAAERDVKNYKNRFMSVLKQAINQRFKVKASIDRETEGVGVLLHKLDFVLDDLGKFKDLSTLCFPESYQLLDFLLLHYHQNLYDIFGVHVLLKTGSLKAHKLKDRSLKFSAQQILSFATSTMGTAQSSVSDSPTSKPLSSPEILEFLGWVHSYESFLMSTFDVVLSDLEPDLFDGKQLEFAHSFIELSKQKVKNYFGNVLAQEETFLSYEDRRRRLENDPNTFYPEVDSAGHFTSGSSTILFQIINQIVDAIIRNGLTGKLLASAFKELCRCLLDFQRSLAKLIDSEFKKIIPDMLTKSPSEDFNTGGLEYFLVMIANNTLKWIEFADKLKTHVETAIHPAFKNEVTEQMLICDEGFRNFMKHCITKLTDIVFYTMKPSIRALFGTSWNNRASEKEPPLICTCVVTMEDFMNDLKGPSAEFFHASWLAAMCERLVCSYLRRMKSKSAYFKRGLFVELFEQDLFVMKEFFTRALPASSSTKIFRLLQPIEKMQSLLTCSSDLLFMETFSLVKTYPDINFVYLEEVLRKRTDGRDTISQMLESVKAKVKTENTKAFGPSIFSKLSL